MKQFKIPVVPLVEDLIKKIETPIKEKYICQEIDTSMSLWIDRYNNIRDSSWPLCKSYNDFYLLPSWMQEECINIHNFSPKIWQDEISKDADQIYSGKYPQLLEHTVKLLENNQSILTHKRIIDIGCRYGQYSIYSAFANPSQVTGIDVRSSSIDVAEAMRENLNIQSDRVAFKIADIHNHEHLKQLCADCDTVLLLGVMYHVHDHYDILKNICQGNVSSIVIEVGEDHTIMHSDQPLIAWKKEKTFESLSGFFNNDDEVLVGYPNAKWFDVAMDIFGFERIDTATFDIHESSQKINQFIRHRSVFLYQKTR